MRRGGGIDEAQSFRAGEYRGSEGPLAQALSFEGRITQDLRLVMQEQGAWVGNQPATNLLRPRLMYRNVTEIGRGFRVTATITGETEGAPRPALAYDPRVPAAAGFVNTALLNYRAGSAFEVAVGRDQLPTGVNIPDLSTFIKARNRLGYYDAPTQIKLFWSSKRFHITPFAFAPGGSEPDGERESGGGALAEVDALGNGRTIIGTTLVRGTAANGDRRTIGGYARLGFGRWGVLAEHDVTDRRRDGPIPSSFQQQASYLQTFVALREWLVASAIAERLTVHRPFEERLIAGRFELASRFTNATTIGVSTRIQRNTITGGLSTSVMVQAAFKTVN